MEWARVTPVWTCAESLADNAQEAALSPSNWVQPATLQSSAAEAMRTSIRVACWLPRQGDIRKALRLHKNWGLLQLRALVSTERWLCCHSTLKSLHSALPRWDQTSAAPISRISHPSSIQQDSDWLWDWFGTLFYPISVLLCVLYCLVCWWCLSTEHVERHLRSCVLCSSFLPRIPRGPVSAR